MNATVQKRKKSDGNTKQEVDIRYVVVHSGWRK
jgi:hypothetical protein